MKRIGIVVICIMLVLTLTACGGSWGGGTYDQDKGDLFTFETETIDGDPFTSEDIKDAKLVMVNLWEPWCGPCVGEMPDLEEIYQELKDEGFVILGVYSDFTQDEEAKQVVADTGVTYPILRMSEEFVSLQSDYVPTTVFMTGEGEILLDDPVIGSQMKDTWLSSIKGLLKDLEKRG